MQCWDRSNVFVARSESSGRRDERDSLEVFAIVALSESLLATRSAKLTRGGSRSSRGKNGDRLALRWLQGDCRQDKVRLG